MATGAFRGAVVVLCLAMTSVSAFAQSRLAIAGSVFEDRMALAIRSHFVGAPNVTVRLYDASSAPLATTRTNAEGTYAFKVERPGDYWVAVDSKSFANGWPEQTFAPAGAQCAHPDGTARATFFEGSCFAGRTAGGSDDPSSLATSEHVARVSLKESSISVDFAFSFDAVTNTSDAAGVQGSFRQFLANANSIPGPNRMRFVPLERPREQRETVIGVPPRWWSITATSAYPAIADDDTIVDGTAYNFLSPASVANPNPGRLGEAPTFRTSEPQIPRLDKPELELILSGAEGLVCNATCAFARMAIHGASVTIAARADARLEHVMIGTAPDALPSPALGSVGLQIEKGTTVARYTLVTGQTRAGILVADGARLEGERLDVTRCGQPESGGGIVLLSDGSVVRASSVTTNPGVGVLIGALDGSTSSTGNIIDGSTISSNQAGVVLSPNAMRNVVSRNEIMWNRLGGITIVPHENKDIPSARENRLTANRFNENGLRPIVLDLDVEDPNALTRGNPEGEERCQRRTDVANGGIQVPRITQVRVQQEEGMARATIRGTACPGEVVELYQSFVTSGVQDKENAELPHVRNKDLEHESLTNQDRTLALPSIGEFNYLGATNTAADGTFEAAFPLPVPVPLTTTNPGNDEETNIWASKVIPGVDASARAFSALAIDPAGNTSEMSVRRKVD